jgi:hypothetical protein
VINNNASNAGSSDSAASIDMAFRAAQDEYMGVNEQCQVAAAQLVDAMSTAIAPMRQLIERQMDAQNRGAAAEAAQLTRHVEEQRLEARAAARDLHLEDRFGAAMRHFMTEVRQTQQQVQQQQQLGQGSIAALTSAVEREASRLNGRIDQVAIAARAPVEALPEATVLAEAADAVPLDRQAASQRSLLSMPVSRQQQIQRLLAESLLSLTHSLPCATTPQWVCMWTHLAGSSCQAP